MVKVKAISRSEKQFTRETKHDIQQIHKNTDPNLHPLMKPREYQRALVATKMDKIFSQPFLGSMNGHSDGISVMAKSQNHLTHMISGSMDGEIMYLFQARFWELSERKKLFTINAHEHMVRGLTFSRIGACFLSTGSDRNINIYQTQQVLQQYQHQDIKPSNRLLSKTPLNNISHHYDEGTFATAGEVVQLWSYERSKPIQTYSWGSDSIIQVKFNQSEPNVMVATGMDRSIILFDIRSNTPLGKNYLSNKSQCVCWNPQEPINFTVGNDDTQCYTFDMRKLEKIRMIHKGHIGSVMDLDYSPTGTEFVTGSYDRTVRIFKENEGASKETYHGKRMQKVFAVQYSQDNEYVLSGSEDMNIRIWKSISYKPVGNISDRHKNAYDQRQVLKDKYKSVQEVRRIQKHQHLPKYIFNAQKKRQIQKESKFRKINNQLINNGKNFEKPKQERVAKIQDVEY